MSSTVFDSFLFRDLFGTPAMRAVFSDSGYLRQVVRFEVALATAEARVGVIPVAAAEAITEHCDADLLDRDRLRAGTETVGYPVLPVVRQLAEQCGEGGEHLHWGATTQDVMDTATVLQCADGLTLLVAALDRLRAGLRRLAGEHMDTLTAGRTHLQHAVPITFGYRAAVWLSALDRHADRLADARRRALMVQLGGAAGTLAAFGDGPEGPAVRAALADELGLRDPEITWHVARDGLVEIVTVLAAIGGSVAKIGADIAMMCSTEFGEVAEPFVDGRGASSTMPQKRNPISSELMIAAAGLLRERAASMLGAMVHDFERATGPWHVEWSALPEAFLLLSSSLHQADFAVSGLRVDTGRMRRNLDLSRGLVVAEAVMMALAPELGRQVAHETVYRACRRALENGTDLASELRRDDAVTVLLTPDAIDRICDPAGYLGSAQALTRAVLDRTGTG